MNIQIRLAAFGLCILGTAAAFAVERDCPPGSYGMVINNPDAGKPTDNDSFAIAAEAGKKKAYLTCSAGDVAPLRKADFKLGPTASASPFVSVTVAALSQPGAKASDVQARIRAIYWSELERAGATLPSYASFSMRSQCQASVPMLKPGEVPVYEEARAMDAILLAPTAGEMSTAWRMLEKATTQELKISCAQALKRFVERSGK
jgi:hypothetical protein